jgi:hypothetical protein
LLRVVLERFFLIAVNTLGRRWVTSCRVMVDVSTEDCDEREGIPGEEKEVAADEE